MRFPAACGSRLPGKNNPYSPAPNKQFNAPGNPHGGMVKMPALLQPEADGHLFCPMRRQQAGARLPLRHARVTRALFPVPYAKGQTHRRSRLALGPVRKPIIPQGAGKAANSLHRHPPQPCIHREKPRQRISGQVAFRHRKRHPALQLFPQCHEFLQISRGAA